MEYKNIKTSLIGQQLYPVDNSYQRNVKTGTSGMLAGTDWDRAKLVTIVSEPYTLETKNVWSNANLHEFVTVQYEGELYICLNNFRTAEQQLRHESTILQFIE